MAGSWAVLPSSVLALGLHVAFPLVFTVPGEDVSGGCVVALLISACIYRSFLFLYSCMYINL